jgi:hypothetical protein
MLEEFGGGQADLSLAYLERANADDFKSAVNRLLEHEASLEKFSPTQKEKLFAYWSERGDLARLGALIDQHQDWLPMAWRGEAKYLAGRGDFRGAFEVVKRFGQTPALPSPAAATSIEQLQKDSLGNPANYEVGLALYRAQITENKIDDALVTVRRFTSRKDVPPYFHFLEAEAWAAKGNWERAWKAREEFDKSSR